jgi:hypothetical protein
VRLDNTLPKGDHASIQSDCRPCRAAAAGARHAADRPLLHDWLWFGEVGFRQVFSTILRAQSLLFIGALVVSVAWFALNVRIAWRRWAIGVPRS